MDSKVFSSVSIRKYESAYDWVVIPEDLPKSNLFVVTAKTASPTIHPEDVEGDIIRLFSLTELHESGRSLGRRPINLNHNQKRNIESAFVVDSQYNPTTEAVESLIYVPDLIRDEINSGEIKKPSVEYVWRDIKKTESGSEFVGLIFDKISLLEESWLAINGYSAGDKLGEIHKVEASGEKRGYIECAAIEKPPEQEMKQDMITEGMKKPEQGFPPKGKMECRECKEECEKCSECSEDIKMEATKFFDAHKGEPFAGYQDFDACVAQNKNKSNPQAYCGYIKHKSEAECMPTPETMVANKMEIIGGPNINNESVETEASIQKPEGTNVMPIAPEGSILNQTPVSNAKPDTNVASAGMVMTPEGGVFFGKSEDTNPHKNLDMPKAPANVEPAAKLEDALITPVMSSNTDNPIGKVIDVDESKQKVEAVQEPAKEPIKEPVKEVLPVVTTSPPVVDTTDYKAEFTKVKAHEAFLEESCKKLSDNAKVIDEKTAKAVADAYKKGKMEVVRKFKEIIPDDSQFGYNIQNSTRSLITNIKKKCFEVTQEC